MSDVIVRHIIQRVCYTINEYDDVYIWHQKEKRIYELIARPIFPNGGFRVLKEYNYEYVLSHSVQEILKDMLDTRVLELI